MDKKRSLKDQITINSESINNVCYDLAKLNGCWNHGSKYAYMKKFLLLIRITKRVLEIVYKKNKHDQIILLFVSIRRLAAVNTKGNNVLKKYVRIKGINENLMEAQRHLTTKQYFHNKEMTRTV